MYFFLYPDGRNSLIGAPYQQKQERYSVNHYGMIIHGRSSPLPCFLPSRTNGTLIIFSCYQEAEYFLDILQ